MTWKKSIGIVFWRRERLKITFIIKELKSVQKLWKNAKERKLVNQIVVTGMVLSQTAIGENDRRVVILSKERGKIAAFARGARRPNSALVGATNPFSFGTFTVYEGRTSYTLVSASISNYFEELRTDIEGAYYGFYFLDLANYYAREANDETMMLKLLYQTLRALTNPRLPDRLIRYIYELKMLCINGEGPQVFECICCGEREKSAVFSVRKGGLVCGKCMNHITDGISLHPSTLYTLQYIVSSPVEKLYNFLVKEEVLQQLSEIVTAYLKEYLGKQFKSLEILETITQ